MNNTISKETQDFATCVAEKFFDEITDLLFLYIERDPALMAEYRYRVAKEGLERINQDLGSAFKSLTKTDNKGECKTPKSILISSYTKHTLPK